MTLTRTTSGLLGYDDFSGTLAKWGSEIVVEAPTTHSIVAGVLQYSQLASGNCGILPMTGISAGTQVVCLRVRSSRPGTTTNTQVGPHIRCGAAGSGYLLRMVDVPPGPYENFTISRRGTSGAYTDLAAYNVPISVNAWYRTKLRASGSSLAAYVDGVLRVTATDATYATGGAGIYGYCAAWGSSPDSGYHADADDFSVCSSDTITVTGLPTGYKVDATDGTTTLPKVTESSGTATLNGGTLFYGSAGVTLRVYNASDVQQGADQTGVYGGDVWAGSGWTQPLTGTASGLGALTAVLALLQPLTGVSTGTAAETATLAQLAGMAAGAVGSGNEAATLAQIRALAADALGAGSGNATIAEIQALAADATGTGTDAAALSEQQSLSGTATGTGDVAAALTLIATLAAAASGVGSATGSVEQRQALTALASGAGNEAATIGALAMLAAQATGTGVLTATMNELAALAATSTGEGTASATLGGGLAALAADARGNATASATLAQLASLAAAATGASPATATLAQVLALAGTALGEGTATAAPGGMQALTAAATGDAPITTTLAGMLTLGDAIAIGAGGAHAALGQLMELAAGACGMATATAQLTTRAYTAAYYIAHLHCPQSGSAMGPVAGPGSSRLSVSADTRATMTIGAEPLRVRMEVDQ